MARYSKKKVIKKKSVNKNKNTRGRKRVSRGKSRRRVKRKYVGGVDNGNKTKADKAVSEYYKIELDENKSNADSKNLFEYIEYLLEVSYLAIVLIFLFCGPIITGSDEEINTAKTKIVNILVSILNNSSQTEIESFVNKLLVPGVKVTYKSAKENAAGGALKGGGGKWTTLKKLLRINVSGASEEHAGNDDSPSSPYIDITYPSIAELDAMDTEYDFFKLMFTTDTLNERINLLITGTPEEINSIPVEPSNDDIERVISRNNANRSEVNRHLLDLYNPNRRATLPSFPDYEHKELATKIAFESLIYNRKNPSSNKVVMSEGTKTESETKGIKTTSL
jgi:hypothetical protein